MTANQTPPTDAKAATLAALEAIQESSEANTALLAAISENLERILSMGSQLADALALLRQPISVASPAQAMPAGEYTEFTAEAVVMTYNDKGEPAYKIVGHPYSRYGVRVWPEVLSALGIDPAQLKPGPNPFSARVVALMGEHGPKKITGRAASQQPAASQPAKPAARSNGAAPTPEDEPPF
jgi:hypothetical protein